MEASLNHVNKGRSLGRASGAMGRKGSGCFDDFAKLGHPTSYLPPVIGEVNELPNELPN